MQIYRYNTIAIYIKFKTCKTKLCVVYEYTHRKKYKIFMGIINDKKKIPVSGYFRGGGGERCMMGRMRSGRDAQAQLHQ